MGKLDNLPVLDCSDSAAITFGDSGGRKNEFEGIPCSHAGAEKEGVKRIKRFMAGFPSDRLFQQ